MRSSFAGREGEGIAHIVAVHGGCAYEQSAFHLRHFGGNKVIYADAFDGISPHDAAFWRSFLRFSEGSFRSLLAPFSMRTAYSRIRSRHWGRHFIDMLAQDRKPLVTTHIIPACAAEEFGYPHDIYIFVPHADIDQSWVPPRPSSSRIRYLVPTRKAVQRLRAYGVLERNIFLTGYPLSSEVFSRPSDIFIDLRRRFSLLDSQGVFAHWSSPFLSGALGDDFSEPVSYRATSVHIAFAVHDVFTDCKVGERLLESLAQDIRKGRVIFTLFLGSDVRVSQFFRSVLSRLHLADMVPVGGVMLFADEDSSNYFSLLHQQMRLVDVLITAPSELSYYVGFGVPVLLTPPRDSRAHAHRAWVYEVGAGMDMQGAHLAHEWLWDLLASGMLARMAFMGYMHTTFSPSEAIARILQGKYSHQFQPHLFA